MPPAAASAAPDAAANDRDAMKYTPQCTNPGWTGQIFKPDPPDSHSQCVRGTNLHPESARALLNKVTQNTASFARCMNTFGAETIHAAMIMMMTMMILF
jgi:hypothetical protein